MRLDKYLSESTPLSRKEIKQHIKKGAAAVNGEIIKKPEYTVCETDTVALCGKIITYEKYIYLMLNKPQGYVSATEDKHYPVVTELVPEEYRHFNVFPAGRLDMDTEGLLLLTNDGAFVHAVTSPKKNVYKRYFARLDKPAEPEDKAAFAAGMEFKDFTAKPARLEICDDPHEVYIEIAEGKFHQVKRMCERVGKTVIYLRRVSIGGLVLPPELALGDMIKLNRTELDPLLFMETN